MPGTWLDPPPGGARPALARTRALGRPCDDSTAVSRTVRWPARAGLVAGIAALIQTDTRIHLIGLLSHVVYSLRKMIWFVPDFYV
ncbi:hypothetical protein EV192_111165 [Actinocrispum wychmicini]|uniref:Uncharacterized protein n=1 Tax=Actinocrispum wychmicini TaxID=1213861 RepID=A0A4R2J3B7_9PSEU|nr:hypothetical protein EV192_111165 [Actinocrispum wychmicini]